ncbi:MAG: hypothetical protein SNF68_07890 [Rikenellaceae bacterium]
MKNISVLKIMLILMMVITIGLVAAAVSTGAPEVMGYNLIWAYFLVTFGLASAVFCAVFGMVKASEGLLKAAISVGVAAAVVIVSYVIASGHSIQIVNLGDGGYFGEWETMISEASIYVTYVVFGAATLAAIGGLVFNFIEGMSKGDLLEEEDVVAEEK